METTELEREIYNALTTNEKLTGKLPQLRSGNFPVYHIVAPARREDRYPIIIYSPISDVPALYSDDTETYHKVTIRISIITLNGEYSELNKIIRQIMTEQLEFERVQTVPEYDFEHEKFILQADYIKIIPA